MIQVDISHVWGQVSLPALLNMEREVFDAHMALTEETGEGSDFLGWLSLPCQTPSGETLQILAAALKEKCGVKNVHIGFVGAVVGAHTGPGVLVVCFLGTKR